MNKKWVKRMAVLGAAVALVMILASAYAVRFNDSRLVVPMDFSAYVYTPKDIPMIAACVLAALYIFALIGLILRAALRNRRGNTVRTVDPRWGFLGLFGLLGFLGVFTGRVDALCFFMLFGLFGFFFEGRMSGTLMDERYRENALRAQLTAYRIGMTVVTLLVILLGQGLLAGSERATLRMAVIVLALDVALVLFLQPYLLWRYDRDNGGEE